LAGLLSIVDGVGVDAVAPLTVWVDRAAARRDDERLRDYAAALAIIDSDEAIQTMVQRLGLAAAPPPREIGDEPDTPASFATQLLKTLAARVGIWRDDGIDSDGTWAKRRHVKATLRIFATALRGSPRRALLALGAQAGSGRAEVDSLLAVFAKKEPALCDELAPSLPGPARELLAKIRGS
jgi:hypothetical protein